MTPALLCIALIWLGVVAYVLFAVQQAFFAVRSLIDGPEAELLQPGANQRTHGLLVVDD